MEGVEVEGEAVGDAVPEDDGEDDVEGAAVVGAAGAPEPLRGADVVTVHSGSSELWASSRSWPMASSSDPAGRPAETWARSEGRRSCSRIRSQSSAVLAWP